MKSLIKLGYLNSAFRHKILTLYKLFHWYYWHIYISKK